MDAGTFEIVVRGTMSPAFLAAFDDFSATRTQYDTRLVGYVSDQARLHGALTMLWDLGVELVSVTRLDAQPGAGQTASERSDGTGGR